MPQKTRIKLTGTNVKELDNICNQIKEISKKFGVAIRGPVPMPTKKMLVPTMKTPCGQGTGHGNTTWDKWEMRIHKRILDIGPNPRALRQVMRIEIPESVDIEIQFKE